MRSRQSFRITCGRRSGYLSGNVAKEYFGTILSGHGVLVPVRSDLDITVFICFFHPHLFGLFFLKFSEEICFRSGFQDENPTSYLWNTLEWLVMKQIP